MPVHNSDIAEAFRRLADLLEIEGGNQYRVRAYRNAAATVEGLPHDAARMIEQGADLSELPGIGEDLAGKIETLIETGELPLLEEVEGRVPEGLAEITHVSGIGPKRAWKLYEELGIETIEALRKAAEAGEIRDIEGFGEKTEQNIIDALGRFEGGEKRLRLMDAEHIAEPLLDYVREIDGVKQAIIAGSYRRQKETVGDLDILVTAKRGSDVMDRFVKYDEVDEVVSKGETRSTVVLQSGFHVDLRVVAEVSYGAALFYFTGSKAHNIVVRKRAIDRGWKLNEYGLFEDNERIAGKTEEEVYEKLDLPFIPPLLRENRGEIEAAENGELPDLVQLDDIRGDLHCHTKWSDGKFTLREMAEAAKDKGYAFLGITDHSKSQTVAGGLSEDGLAKQIDEIDELNEELDGIRLLKGSEVDILENGKLDFSDNILAQLDYVICAIHGGFNLSREKQTERVLRAMDNKHFNILAHATGRLINERAPYEIDLDRIMTEAEDRGCFLELNAHPNRLDIDDARCKMARDMGLMVPIGTDAHSINGLETMRFGVAQAGRGWLEAKDVLNTRAPDELLKLMRR
ncbi:DNA polymerase/3'-5' exonuclease PolX [Dichotomicrobium thermohalophilum]|uniref:DNA polymerase beta n=1 Tax=Dichotomicrobium thermohalophilum TaxID=933063 RepID=A0A397Q3M4_9HYPH|nr:DNA polymerase/3'-5' exonuclease PolX [Dichotomicrobium thermohalophilum]RIA55722.1 DNA polymerase (family 10) [Dichotomicrobium thermohalophilum]